METDILTLAEVAAYLRCHQTTIYRLLKKRKLPAMKIGRDWRFSRKQIEAWRETEERKYERDPNG